MENLTNQSEKAQYDFRLVQEALKGNEMAYAELMNRYEKLIYFQIHKSVQNVDDAEDLTMLTFSKAFKSLESFNTKYAFNTWLSKIAVNNTIDFFRKKRLKTVSMDSFSPGNDEDFYFQFESNAENPEEIIVKSQKYDLIRKSIDSVKPRYRKLIELRYFKEFSYEEISEELNLPIGTVKTQLHRAKSLLSNILDPFKNNL